MRADIAEMFTELSADGCASDFQAAFERRQQKARYAQEYDAERAKWIRCVPALKKRLKEIQSAYEKRKWQKTRADERLRAAHNANRRAAHARLKADPERLAIAKRKQAVHSRNHSLRRRSTP